MHYCWSKSGQYTLCLNLAIACYCAPMKLWKDQMCLSVILSMGGVLCDNYPWCIGPHCTGFAGPCALSTWHLTAQRPSPRPWSYPDNDIWWLNLETCSNFTWGPLPLVLTSGGYWSTYGWHKQAVCILLECFLVPALFSAWFCKVINTAATTTLVSS